MMGYWEGRTFSAQFALLRDGMGGFSGLSIFLSVCYQGFLASISSGVPQRTGGVAWIPDNSEEVYSTIKYGFPDSMTFICEPRLHGRFRMCKFDAILNFPQTFQSP